MSDGRVTEEVNAAQERSRPVKLHPPKFADDIHPEIARYHREIAEAIEAESSKNWQMRREMERVDNLSTTINRMHQAVEFWTQATKEMMAQHNHAANTLATITAQVGIIVAQNNIVMVKIEKAFDEIRKLEAKTYDFENDLALIQMTSSDVVKKIDDVASTVGKQGNRIGALETLHLVASSEKVGQQKLLTKGRVVGGVAYTVGIAVVAKWSWFISLFHK